MDKEIRTYIRDNKKNPIGVIVAVRDGNTVKFGFSLTKTKSGDIFNGERGVTIAVGRALCNRRSKARLPKQYLGYAQFMAERAKRYFQNCTLDLNQTEMFSL